MLARAKNIFKFFLGIPLTIISLYFIFSFIFSNRDEILPHLGSINPLPFTLGVLFLVIFFLLRSLAWHQILKREGYEETKSKSIYLLASSEIKRYIPGSVLGFISRVNNFSSDKVSSKAIVKLIFYESIIFLVSSVVTSIPGIYYISSKTGELPSIYYVAIFFLIALSATAVTIVAVRFSKKYSLNFSLFVKKLPEFKDAFMLMLVAWIFFGIGNYLLGASFYYLEPKFFIELSSFFILSWLIGYVVLVVPLGLGVREAAVVYGLASIMPAGFAAALSIILRIGLVLSELIFLLAAFVLYKFRVTIPKIPLNLFILWSAIISYIGYFTYYSIERHNNFFSGRFDLGNMDQTVWNTLHGRIFLLTNPDGTENMLRLGVHADFILILLAPFYLLWEDPKMLLVTQTVVIALGAYFVYKIAEHFFPHEKFLPLVFSISYLLNPWVQRQNLFDFHAVALATTFLLASVFFMLKEKYKYFLIFLTLAFLTKENVYLVGFLIGVYLFFKTRSKNWLLLSALSLSAFYILVSRLIPWARSDTHFAINYFGAFGDSIPQILTTALFNPIFTVTQLLTLPNIQYLTDIFLPLGFLPLLSPVFLVFALPDLSISLFSENENLRGIHYHYGAVIIPFIYLAAISGVKNLASLKIPYINTKTLIIYVMLTALYSSYMLGTLPGAKHASLDIYTRYLPERTEIKKFLTGIHPDLSVAATNNLGAHLSHRDMIYTLPRGLDEADVVVMLFERSYLPPSPNDLRGIDQVLAVDERYIEVYRVGGFSAFAKIEAAYKITSPY